MKLRNQIMSYLNKLTVQEKKFGYAAILYNYLIYVRSGVYKEELVIRTYAQYLHELPPFLGRDLLFFDDESFWDPILENELIATQLFAWFCNGVDGEKSRYNTLKKIQKHQENEAAE